MIDQFFRKLIKEDRSAAGPHSRPKSDRKASSHMLQASHIVVPIELQVVRYRAHM